MGLVEDEHGAPTVARGRLEALLEPEDEGGVGAGGRGTTSRGDLAAHVPLGEACDLHVVHVVPGLGQAGEQLADDGGLAGAGGRDERGRHATVEGVLESIEGLLVHGQSKMVLGGDLAGEGGRVVSKLTA